MHDYRYKERAVGEIENLMSLAETNKGYSDRYVQLANRISMKCKVKIPKDLKYRFCKSCKTYFVFGENVMVRVCDGKLVVTCKTCKHIRRIPLHGAKTTCSGIS